MSWTHYLPALLKGAEVTALIAIASTLLGAVFAFGAGLARFAGGRLLSSIAIIYIEIFRGTSLLVQLFWLYYALPLIGISFDPVTTGIVGLALNIGAYGAEVVRGIYGTRRAGSSSPTSCCMTSCRCCFCSIGVVCGERSTAPNRAFAHGGGGAAIG